MRVLHFYKTAFPSSMGGVEQVIHQIASGAVTRGIGVDVLSMAREPSRQPFEIDGVRMHQSRQLFEIASTPFSLSAIRRFSQLARQADVVHYHFPWPFMDLVHFVSSVRKPTLVTYHSDIVRQRGLLSLYRPLKRNFLGSVNRIVSTSPNYLATSDVLAEYQSKISVIPIGLDKRSYPPIDAERLAYWRQRFDQPFFLFVGVLRYYKGLHILLEAARHTPFNVVIVGAGPVEHELQSRAMALGLNNVHFLGFVSDQDKVALLELSLALVFPSHLRSEAFGVSLLEGAMYGKPMISCEIGTGTTYINIAGQTGLVVPPSNPDALREAMRYLWDCPEVASEMGRRAEERYRTLFTADSMVDAYVRIYEELAGGDIGDRAM